MNEELIIDGRRVDMSPDTRIVLNFKSNLLGDISKISASNSQTISLPKTTRNREIFDHATAPSYNSAFRYRKHAAEYSRNGVKIISDAYAVLLDSADNYEVALYWGEMTKFQLWVNSGLKISDLDFSTIYQVWKSPPTIATCYNGNTPDEFYYPDDSFLYYVDYDNGLGSVETMPSAVSSKITLHPVMSVRRLLLKIQEEAGIKFEFPAGFMDRKDATAPARSGIFQGLAIPMLTRKDNSQQTKTITLTGHNDAKNSMNRYAGLIFTAPASEHYTLGTRKYDMFFGGQVEATTIKFTNAGHVKMSIFITVQMATKWINRNWVETPSLELGINGVIKIVPCRVGGLKQVGQSPGWRYHTCELSYTYEADVDEGHEVSLLVEMGKDSEFYKYYSNTATAFSPASITVNPPQAEINISLGDYFRVNGNLPDVGQLDLVKALSAMYGLSVVPSGKTDTLKFIRLDDLFNNRANAVDWSDKLIASGGGEPDRVKYTLGDYVRKNNFKYAEDTTVQANGDGSFYIDNESLEPQKDIITLPFAPCDEKVVKTVDDVNYYGAIVPIYKMNEDGEIEMNTSLKPRILKIVSDGTPESSGAKAIGRFIPITFTELLSKYYGMLSKVVNNAITITENFRLTEFDLLNLDFAKPVYLKQYGRYYGIVSVQTNDGYCAVELLQFPVGDSVSPTLLYAYDGSENWEANLKSWSGRLTVKTIFGGTVSAEEISAIGEAMTGPAMGVLDLRPCQFLGTTLYIASKKFGDRYSLEYIAELYLPKGIERISERAFEISRGVREYHFQEGLKEIAYMAFSYNYALERIEFPASVKKIGGYAFYMCQKLAIIVFNSPIPPEIDNTAFSQMGQTIPQGTPKLILIPSGTYALYSTVAAFSYLVSGQGYTIQEQ